MMKMLIAGLVAAAPMAASAAILVENPTIRPTIGQQGTSAAYMTLRNTGAADRLVSAECACADSVMAHRTITTNGIARMEMEMAVPVPAGGAVVFDARGRHLMLVGIKAPIRAGAEIPITLTFEKAGKVSARFTAANMAGMTGMAAHEHQHAH